jgi:hypothetical protein
LLLAKHGITVNNTGVDGFHGNIPPFHGVLSEWITGTNGEDKKSIQANTLASGKEK